MPNTPPIPSRLPDLGRILTAASVRRPRLVVGLALLATALLLAAATRLRSEVGYAAYFGPEDPAVHRLEAFLEEFESGLHVLVAFGCPGSRVCGSFREPVALELLGRLQTEIDRIPNVRSTRSLLNAPILVGPLETRTVAEPHAGGGFELAPDFAELVARAPAERFLGGVVVSDDLATAGIVVELQSLESAPVRGAVHALLALLERYEAELGGEIYAAGDPVWTVASDDDLDVDARNLTALMFATIAAILWAFFRDARFTLLPLAAVAALTVQVHGVIALLGVPMTTILAALPPLLAVIAVTTSVHLLAALARIGGPTAPALVAAADEVGPACFWASLTTAAGFASFGLSELASFRHFGLVSAIAFALAFVGTFTLLPALLCLLPSRRPVRVRAGLVREVIAAALGAATGRPRFVLAASAIGLAALAAGIPRLYYEVDFGSQSLVLRSVRFIEASFRGPMTTELVVTLPRGAHVYDPESLALLARIERWFEGEPSTGAAFSFLDFLEEAARADRGRAPADVAELAAAAPSAMLVASQLPGLASFWSESPAGDDGTVPRDPARNASSGPGRERARVSVHRRWLDGREQIPYLERLGAFVAELNREGQGMGYTVELAGGLELAARAERRIRETQWTSFAGAFGVVAAAMAAALWRSPALLVLGIAANVLPVVALLGLMGWAGVAVDPANAMVAAILLAVAEDDTMHVAIRYLRERATGLSARRAIVTTLEHVGEPLVVTGICLALGFAVLMFSRWGGLVSFGLLASLGIILALVGDLLLVPAALCRERERT
jgi:predicted RND superfamily exporter protein